MNEQTSKTGYAKSISIESPAKINLSIDVVGKRPDGMHEVDMIMQAIDFCDTVTVTVSRPGASRCHITCSDPDVPTDERNICWKAVRLMRDTAAVDDVTVDILKRVPVAAGMAGGSGNGAAVLHALNRLWDLGLSTAELMETGGRLGADVPFCVLAQAERLARLAPETEAHGQQTITAHRYSPEVLTRAARARGTGTDITPVSPLAGYVAFAKPAIGVSTKEVYKGIDRCEIKERPDNERLAEALAAGDREAAAGEMINVLELYTLEAEPEVAHLKRLMEAEFGSGAGAAGRVGAAGGAGAAGMAGSAEKILMSGSGPTVFALFGEDSRAEAEAARERLRSAGYEAHCAAL
ncbi:MAG: 4-(cytidine 5'-diphospho)-2-C-methyl-D-erythritol kinase [Firmicutes bacterium]|nr:4-(cytidine 5'-diphospho)-2-C-methyl-D-erythritol kinase [Bacillota bacterium]